MLSTPLLVPDPAPKLSPEINVALGGAEEVFGRHTEVGLLVREARGGPSSVWGPNLAKLQIVANETQRAPQQS